MLYCEKHNQSKGVAINVKALENFIDMALLNICYNFSIADIKFIFENISIEISLILSPESNKLRRSNLILEIEIGTNTDDIAKFLNQKSRI